MRLVVELKSDLENQVKDLSQFLGLANRPIRKKRRLRRKKKASSSKATEARDESRITGQAILAALHCTANGVFFQGLLWQFFGKTLLSDILCDTARDLIQVKAKLPGFDTLEAKRPSEWCGLGESKESQKSTKEKI